MYLEGIAGQVDRLLAFLQGASPLDWAVYSGILRGHKGRAGNEEQTARGCEQGGNLNHDDKRLLVNGEDVVGEWRRCCWW